MNTSKYFVVALMSATLISLEIVWTRLFSAEFFYTFAFLTISLAILGLGLGALALHLFPFFNRRGAIGILLSISAALALAGPPVVFHIGLNFTQLFSSWAAVGKFVLTIALLGAPFFLAGIALARLFKENHQNMPRLYMADLLGAGLGVLVAILFMNQWGTPLATALICLPLLLAAFIAARRTARLLPVLVMILLVFVGYKSDTFIDMPREERAPVIYKHWDAMAKIKIYDYGEEARGINIDNAANSPVYAFDGNWDRPDSMKFGFGINVEYLVQQHNPCTFMSLGAGGGTDVLQALQEGASEIHAVEVNPHINWLMTKGDLADFSGNIYNDPRVRVITEDARAYVRRFKNTFDVIYSLSSNTFAALASGSFALAENYLFTKEAFEDYYDALTEHGFLSMEHQFYMPRIASEALQALRERGVKNPEEHIAIYDLPRMRRNLLLLSKAPLTEEIRQNAYGKLTPENYGEIHLLYPAPDSTADNLINRIVTQGWENVAADAKIDISPTDDNRPFTAQLGLWKNLDFSNMKKVLPYEFFGFPLSKLIITIIMLIIAVLILPLNLLPYLTKGKKLRMAPWLYFFAIGVGFMVVEVVLIQKYTLFIGPSSYSFVTILLTLLLSSGIGSRFADKFSNKAPFIGILIWLAFEILLFPRLTYALSGLEMVPRMAVTLLMIFPLGFFMGMPFPKGAQKVRELIDWGFAVNGAASVLGSAAILLVSFNYGFNIALMLGGFVYLLAFALIRLQKAW